MNNREFANPSPPPTLFQDEESNVNFKAVKVKKEPVEEEYGEFEEGEYVEPLDPMAMFLFEQFTGSKDQKFHCEVCNSDMNSEEIYLTHLKGKRHQKKVAAANYVALAASKPVIRPDIKIQQIKTTGCPMVISTRTIDCRPYIQTALDDYQESPIIGLNFVSEIRMADDKQDVVYYCYLCASECQSMALISHVIGFRHRMAYLRLVNPKAHDVIENSLDKKSTLGSRAERFAARFEEKDGRGKMMVEVQVTPEDEDLEILSETKYPEFPPSLRPRLIEQAKSMKLDKRNKLVLELLKILFLKQNPPTELEKKLQSVVKTRENAMHDKMIKLMSTDMKKLIFQKVKDEDYLGIVEALLKVELSMGMLGKPIVSSVMQKPGIVYPVKKESK